MSDVAVGVVVAVLEVVVRYVGFVVVWWSGVVVLCRRACRSRGGVRVVVSRVRASVVVREGMRCGRRWSVVFGSWRLSVRRLHVVEVDCRCLRGLEVSVRLSLSVCRRSVRRVGGCVGLRRVW